MSENNTAIRDRAASEECACACKQNLQDYVLNENFINALQNIKQMITDAISGTSFQEVEDDIWNKVTTELQKVWKHYGLISANSAAAAKTELLDTTKNPLVEGHTKVLSYPKTVTTGDETQIVQMNDVYVCLKQKENDAYPLKWVKIVTTDFVNPESQETDYDFYDILRKMTELDEKITNAISVITSVWSYLCKKWWEFVDVIDHKSDLGSIDKPLVGQNYFCKENDCIYVYIKTGVDRGEDVFDWIALPTSENAWRHTEVVTSNGGLGEGKFIGETKFVTGAVDTPTQKGDVYVWLPTGEAETNHWVNLTRNHQINGIQNYNPENIVIVPKYTQYEYRFRQGTNPNYQFIHDDIQVERYGQMVNIKINFNPAVSGKPDNMSNPGYGRRSAFSQDNYEYQFTYGFGSAGEPNTKGYLHIHHAAEYCWPINYTLIKRFWSESFFKKPPGEGDEWIQNRLWQKNEGGVAVQHQGFHDAGSFFNIVKLFDGYAENSINQAYIPQDIKIDGVSYEPATFKTELDRLCEKYHCNNDDLKIRYRTLLAKFFCPAATVATDGPVEYFGCPKINPNVLESFYNEEAKTRYKIMCSAIYNMFPDQWNAPTASGDYYYRMVNGEAATKLKLVLDNRNSTEPACGMSGRGGSGSIRIEKNGWISTPEVTTTDVNPITALIYYGTFNVTYVGRNMSLPTDIQLADDYLTFGTSDPPS